MLLIVKPERHGSKDKDGQKKQQHLGAVLGLVRYAKHFIKARIDEWVLETHKLDEIATFELLAANTALTCGMRHRWNFLMRTLPGSGYLLETSRGNSYRP